MLRVATYYVDNGREVDVYLKEEGAGYLVKDAFLHDFSCDYDHFPTWVEVLTKFEQLDKKNER